MFVKKFHTLNFVLLYSDVLISFFSILPSSPKKKFRSNLNHLPLLALVFVSRLLPVPCLLSDPLIPIPFLITFPNSTLVSEA